MGKIKSKSMKAKKSLGQNFLIDINVLKNIKNNISAKRDDLIIEIGPGRGALTKYLKETNAQIICYEIDNDLKPYLNSLIDEKTQIIYQDILKTDIKKDIQDIKYNNLYIVGNLPYYITTPILKYIISLNLDVKEMLFMVQDEVADRFSSGPKSRDYGSISLYLQYYFDVEKLFRVSKNAFNPVPKVESAIIKMTKREDKPQVEQEKYFRLINDAFKMKRKTLKNNLKDYNFSAIEKVLQKNNLRENIRAEEISEKVFVDILREIDK